jgi:phosphoglycolate phosphatase-like HAD superfamily hydrolase
MNLVIFDVDGTLTRTTATDAQCFQQAVSDTFGIQIDCDWSTYQHQTDAGIVGELLERQGLRGHSSAIAAVRRRLTELLTLTIEADPSACLEVPGAGAMIENLRELSPIAVAIATGAWADSARMKLRYAGIRFEGLAFASSDDSPTREEIIRIALGRAAARTKREFGTVTYVGDAPWDARAARALGINFVGVAASADDRTRLTSAGAELVLSSLADRETFLNACGSLHPSPLR